VRSILSVDSTSVRVHQHAAGARNDVLISATVTGGTKELQDYAAERNAIERGIGRMTWLVERQEMF
jgi:hypothetical protein